MSDTDTLTTDEAARYLRLSPATLKVYRSGGRGPKFYRAHGGRRIVYRKSDLDAYLDEDADVAAFARAAVRMADAVSKVNGTDLDVLMSLFLACADDDRKDRPAMADFWQRLAEWLLLEFARRERPLPAKPEPRPAADSRPEPSPYL